MRLGMDAASLRAIIGGKNPADATVIQTRWIEETLRD